MENIRQKLKLIDSQYAWRTDFHNQLLGHCPLAIVAAGIICGITIQNFFGDISYLLWISLAGLCVAAIVVFKKNFRKPAIIIYLTLASFVCLGAIRVESFEQPWANDIRNFVGEQRILATIRGQVITEPSINQNKQWRFAKFSFSAPSSGFYLKVTDIESVDGWKKGCGTVKMYVSGGVLDLKEGDILEAYCWLERFKGASNPGQFDIAKYMARQNVFVSTFVESKEAITILNRDGGGFLMKSQSKLRQIANSSLLGDISSEDESYGMIQALLLGERYNIDSKTYHAFSKTGLLHLVSLSGLNMGILIGLVWSLCRIAGLQKRRSGIICIIAIIIFTMVVPASAPTLRAALMAMVFCAALLLRRQTNAINSLSLAAIILLLVNPNQLFDVGWQLSFGCTLGILLFNERIRIFLREYLSAKEFDGKIFYRILKKGWRLSLDTLAVGIAAWIGGAGFLLYHFHTITWTTCLWTVVTAPFVTVILIAGFLKIILASILPSAAAVLGWIVSVTTLIFVRLVEIIAEFDPTQILVGDVSALPIILYYGLAAFSLFIFLKRHRLKRAISWGLCVLITFLIFGSNRNINSDKLVINFLDVGHGQAAVGQLPDGKNILFDAGSIYKTNIGSQIVLPFLNNNGISKLDAVLLSHSDIDHINGLPEIAQGGAIRKVYGNVTFFDQKQAATVKTLKDALQENGLTVEPIGKDFHIESAATMKILWPKDDISPETNLGANEKSTVTLIEFGGRKVLLCSDIEKISQEKLLEIYPDLYPDIMTVPHHGSTSTLSPDFIKKLNPEVLVYSCDRTIEEKHKADKSDCKAKSFYTASDGAIKIEIGMDGNIKVESFKHDRIH